MPREKVSHLIAKWERGPGDESKSPVYGGHALPVLSNAYAGSQPVPMAEVVSPPSPPQGYATAYADHMTRPSAPRSEPLKRNSRFDINKYIDERATENAKTVSTPNYDPKLFRSTRNTEPSAPRSVPSRVVLARSPSKQSPLTVEKAKSPLKTSSPRKRKQYALEGDLENDYRRQNLIHTPSPSTVVPKKESAIKSPSRPVIASDLDDNQSHIQTDVDPNTPHPGEPENQPREPEMNPNNISKHEAINPYGQVVVLSGNRKCRDVLCFVLFISSFVAFVAVSVVAGRVGNLAALQYGTDYLGRLCGSCGFDGDEATCEKPLLALNPSMDPEVFGVCVEKCPETGETICPLDANATIKDCWKVFVPHKPLINRCVPIAQLQETCLESPYLSFANESLPLSTDDPLCGTCLDPVYEPDGIRPKNPSASDCRAKSKSTQVAGTKESLHSSLQVLVSWTESMLRFLGDVSLAWQSIALSGFLSLIASGLWLGVFAFASSYLLWTTIFIVIFGMAALAIRLLIAGGVFPQSTFPTLSRESDGETVFEVNEGSRKETLIITGWVLLLVSILLSLLACSVRKSVVRVSGIMRSATKVILFNPILWWNPILTGGFVLGVFGWCVTVVALLASAGRINSASVAESFGEEQNSSINAAPSNNDVSPLLLAFVVFAGVWTIFTIRVLGSMVLSAEIASLRYKEYPQVGLCKAIYLMVRFHIGTAAFGSLVIVILKCLRVLLSLMDRAAKRIGAGSKPREGRRRGGGICCARTILALLTCCLSCFGGFFRFATRFSYVTAAVKGEPFCPATKSAFALLSSEILESGSSLFLAETALFFGRLIVVACSAACTYVLLVNHVFIAASDVSSFVAPICASGALAWLVSGACFDLYSSAVDTLLICRLDILKRKQAMREDNLNQQAVSMV